jgi:hypothetical protein
MLLSRRNLISANFNIYSSIEFFEIKRMMVTSWVCPTPVRFGFRICYFFFFPNRGGVKLTMSTIFCLFIVLRIEIHIKQNDNTNGKKVE